MQRSQKGKIQQARAIAWVLRHEMRRYKEPVVGVVERDTRDRVPASPARAGRVGGDPFQVLITTVLSLRTKDATTAAAATRLFRRARTPTAMLRLSQREIASLIYPVGMYPTKARWVREISRTLLEKHGAEVPRTREELLALPGVGRKVANLVLGLCFGVPTICVDTHVHRISNRLGLVRTREPEETERALELVLPKDIWVEWNDLLVTWGQNVCVPVSPFCGRCVLREKLCPRVGVSRSR